MQIDLYELFQNPTAAYRGKPFWAWNGKLTKEELLRQADVFKNMGFGGYFMHSRTGLATEYLGEEWFALTREVADYAREQGMEAWLYDEDRWPSGSAGGKATQKEHTRMQYIQLSIQSAQDFAWQENTMAAFTARMDGFAAYDVHRLPQGETPKGTVLHFTHERMTPHSNYNGAAYLDTMSAEAVEHYLDLTHRRYAKECEGQLGTSIAGIFTDEPHRGALMDNFGSTEAIATGMWRVPYTDTLFARYRERYGEELLEQLPQLFLFVEGEKISPVKWRTVDLLETLFIENFLVRMQNCCRENNMLLTGHALHEDSLAAQTAMIGSVMRFYEHMDYPGIDLLSEHNDCYWIAKQLSSVARQCGKQWRLSELYGCTGWQFPFEGHKRVGDWQALMGIDVRCPHLSWYTMQGEAKRDYPASIFFQSAWWEDYRHVEDYFSRFHVVMRSGEPVTDTLVIHPVESAWCSIFPGWSNQLRGITPEFAKLEKDLADMFGFLMGAQIDFDYGDEEMLSRLGSVQMRQGKPVLRLGQAEYTRVVLGGMLTVRASTLALLREFAKAGGCVVQAGERPPYVDAKAGDSSIAGARQVPFEREAIVQAVGRGAVEVQGEGSTSIYAAMRRGERGQAVVLLNMEKERWVRGATVRIHAQGQVQQWNLADGTRSCPHWRQDGEYIEIAADFAPGQERVYIIGEEPSALPAPVPQTLVERVPLAGEFAYTLSEPNVLVLDMPAFRIGEGEWQSADEILQVDRAVRTGLGLPMRGGDMLQPWFIAGSPRENLGRVSLRFSFAADALPKGGVELALEQPQEFTVRVNGQEIPIKDLGWWIDPCLRRLAIPDGVLHEGQNEIELCTDYHAGAGLEAIYLLGGFGVALTSKGPRMTMLPERLCVGDLVAQGLPFYGGLVTLTLPAPRVPGPGERAYIELANMGGCAAVRAGERLIGWQPYRAEVSYALRKDASLPVTLLLTRRNTFGPLHAMPALAGAYGPGSFLTRGEHYTSRYVTLPNGLLTAPVLEIVK